MIKLKQYFKVNKNKKGIYDIELQEIDELKKFSSVECHVLVYPLSREVCAKDIACNPFEEYAEEIVGGHNF